MASPEVTEDALLQWVNTFPLDDEVKSLADLSDGLAFAQMLEDISPEYAVKDAVKNSIPSKWLRKKKALEAVYKSLLRFLQNHTEYNPNELDAPVDLDSIAENDDVEQITQLASLFLIAAVLSGDENSTKYSMRMGDFDQKTIVKIQEIVSQQVASQARSKSPISTPEKKTAATKTTKDLDLALEEDHARLKAELTELKKKHADFITRFDVLDYSHEELKSRNAETEEALEKLRGSQDDDQAKVIIISLQKQLQESNDLIASQEQQINSNELAKRQQNSELASLKADSKRLAVLEDEVRELKNENTLLARKANRADHFEKKIESLVSTQKENEKLKETNEVLIANMREWDHVHAELAKMQNSVERYQKMHANQELDIVELERRIKIYQQETNKQKDELDDLRAQKDTEERFYVEKIEELTGGHQQTPESPTVALNKTLEQELEDDELPASTHSLEISRLKAEIQLLRSPASGSIRTELDDLEKARKQLDENFRKLTVEHVIAQDQLNALVGKSATEKDQIITSTRTSYITANNELLALKNQLEDLQTDLSQKELALIAAKADLAALDQTDVDQLAELKEAHGLITTSLENNLRLLQDKHTAVSIDLGQKTAHLEETILTNHNLSNKIEGGSADDTQDDNKKRVVELLQQQSEKQELTILDLERRLKAAEDSSPEAQKAATETMIKNLTRENALISTAWYDLTSRLQSNHVVLQRRQDAPKSWLSKQRQIVNATPRR